jgi:hypothetical protein
VTDPVLLDQCILDVAFTGDSSFANAAAATPAPLAGDPAVYAMSVDDQSMQVDIMGVFAFAPNGRNDGVFDVTAEGPITALRLDTVDANGNQADGQHWDTVPAGDIWYLGVEEGGKLINNADSSIPALSPGLHTLRIFADSSGYFVSGQHYRLSYTLPDGTQVGGPVITYDARPAIPGLYNTGVNGNGVALAGGAADPHYALLSPSQNAVVVSTPYAGWVHDTSSSQWVWETSNGTPLNVTLTFRTTFVLNGLDPTTASISGSWATDNYGLSVALNGHDLAITSAGYGALTPFTIPRGSPFVAGTNTLDFTVQDGGGIAGFLVSGLTGSADPLPGSSGP